MRSDNEQCDLTWKPLFRRFFTSRGYDFVLGRRPRQSTLPTHSKGFKCISIRVSVYGSSPGSLPPVLTCSHHTRMPGNRASRGA
jgi:hypothetical protein